MRYGARPPIALDRLRRLPGGRIAYRIKTLRDGRARHRVMTPLELLARLAALVPPPRYPLLRYHGVLAPRSPWRRDVVPRAPEARGCSTSAETPWARDTPPARPEPRSTPRHGASPSSRSPAPPSASAAAPLETRGAMIAQPLRVADAGIALLAPNVLGVKHWSRLLGGILFAASPRVAWATLLRRSFDVDVLACPSCGGRLRVIGEVTEPVSPPAT
jgi:hypothetical protein